MSEILVVGSETYSGTQAAITAAITGIGGATLIVTADNSIASVYARTWAVTNGVTFINLGYILPGNGFTLFNTPLAADSLTTPTHVLTAGTHARVTAASGSAAARGRTLVQI